MKEKYFIYLGLISPALFWLTTIVCGLMIEDYNHFSNIVSELGALGSKPQYIFSIGLTISSFLNILFVIGVYRICNSNNINTIPLLFMFFFSFLAGPAIFPMPLRLHGIIGIPFPLIILSPILALIFWRNIESRLKVRTIAILSLIIMLLGFLIFFPSILSENFGLKQRFLYLGWTLWTGYLALRFIKLILNNNEENVIITL